MAQSGRKQLFSFESNRGYEDLPKILEAFEIWAGRHHYGIYSTIISSLIIDELFSNTVAYGYKKKDGWVKIDVAESEDSLVILYKDKAGPINFSSLGLKSPLIPANGQTINLDSIQIGGLGLYLARHLTSSIDYQRTDSVNIIRLYVDCFMHYNTPVSILDSNIITPTTSSKIINGKSF